MKGYLKCPECHFNAVPERHCGWLGCECCGRVFPCQCEICVPIRKARAEELRLEQAAKAERERQRKLWESPNWTLPKPTELSGNGEPIGWRPSLIPSIVKPTLFKQSFLNAFEKLKKALR